MSTFTDPLQTTKIGERKWRIEKSFEFYLEFPYDEKVVIEKGFKTDGATVPRIFWSIAPPMSGRYPQAAVVHDYLIDGGFISGPGTNRRKCSHYEADLIFLKAMKVLKTPSWQRYTIFGAVRLFGLLKPIIDPIKSLFKRS